jgi:SAM-dependent methyltransferase
MIENMKEIEHEDYTRTSKVYDQYRVPAGFEDLHRYIKDIVPEGKGKIIEVGCGTGNYLTKLSENGKFELLVGLDLNEGMLEQLKSKIINKPFMEVSHASAQSIPYKDGFFDVVYGCQTLHHYGDDEFRIQFFQEAFRILRPGGRLIINFYEPHQSLVMWNLVLCPKAIVEDIKKQRTADENSQMAKQCGFNEVDRQICKESWFNEELYYDFGFMLKPQCFDSDSTFSLASDKDKKFCTEICKEMKGENNNGYIDVMKKMLTYYGSTTFLVFEK